MLLTCAFALLHYIIWFSDAKTIDNKLRDTPTVQCGPERISIQGDTEEPFEGVIFIKNYRRTDGCAVSFNSTGNVTKPEYSIALDRIAQCGLELRRNPDTKQLEIFTVFVFSFHPNFVTAGDRSFAVHCIFLQQQVTVATKFNFISDITTRGIVGATAEIPRIALTILPGRVPDVGLEPAHTVTVGEPLMYVWHLNADTEIYGIRVKECFAESKDGRKMQIIDGGCTLDSILVSNVQYSENNLKAFSDAMAFKFPDVEDVWISCAVSICIRRFEHLLTPDQTDENLCDNQPKCGSREKRSTEDNKVSSKATIYSIDDLVNHKLTVIDTPLDSPVSFISQNLTQGAKGDILDKVELCLEKTAFAGLSAALISAYFITIAFAGAIGFSLYRSHKNNNIIAS